MINIALVIVIQNIENSTRINVVANDKICFDYEPFEILRIHSFINDEILSVFSAATNSATKKPISEVAISTDLNNKSLHLIADEQ